MSQVRISFVTYSEGGYEEMTPGRIPSVVEQLLYPTGKIPRLAKGYHFQIQGVYPDGWDLVQQKLACCESMVEFNFRFNGGNSYVDVHLTDEKDITWLRLALA
jgi:hypothetical protein